MVRRERSPRRAIVLGSVALFVGGYYLLQQTFGIALPDIAWDKIWPILLIGFGLLLFWTAYPALRGERGA
jgi:hypothetical protein